METHSFQADAKQILKLVTHSIYSDREIFFRELLSNASDALDKARFISLQQENYRKIDGEPGIRVTLDSENKTLTIEDDGVGMTTEEIVKNLGTIAQSGTKAKAISEERPKMSRQKSTGGKREVGGASLAGHGPWGAPLSKIID